MHNLKLLHMSCVVIIACSDNAIGQVQVDGYFRDNGDYVQEHERSYPDGIEENNRSYEGESRSESNTSNYDDGGYDPYQEDVPEQENDPRYDDPPPDYDSRNESSAVSVDSSSVDNRSVQFPSRTLSSREAVQGQIANVVHDEQVESLSPSWIVVATVLTMIATSFLIFVLWFTRNAKVKNV